MEKTFMALMGTSKNKTVVEKKGEYDSKNHVFYCVDNDVWSASDEFTGTLLVNGKTSKKECEQSVKAIEQKLKEFRNSEKYLQGVIAYRELKGDL